MSTERWAQAKVVGVAGPWATTRAACPSSSPLSHAAPLVRLAATIGLFVVIPPAIILIFGKDPVFTPTGLGGASAQFRLYDFFGTTLNLNQVVVMVTASLIAVGITVLLRYTSFGLAVRAVVDSDSVSAIFGTNTHLVSAAAWAIGMVVAGLAGILVLPFLGLDPNGFTCSSSPRSRRWSSAASGASPSSSSAPSPWA